MRKRKLKKVTQSFKSLLKKGKKTLICKMCDIVSVEVGADIGAVTCAYCVQKIVEPPPEPKVPSEFPRGWALKNRYVHKDGVVYSKGKPTGEVVKRAVKKKKTVKKKAKASRKPARKK